MEAVREAYEELNAPSAERLYKVLKSRGVDVPRKDVVAFVKGQSERQVQAPTYRYTGKIASQKLHDRWFADLIDFTAAPAEGTGKRVGLDPTKDGEKYILVVQDVFSRFLWARALTNKRPETVRAAFAEIRKEAGTKPRQLLTDKGPEFLGQFQNALQNQGIRVSQKAPDDKNAIATIDTAIGNLKKAMARYARRTQDDDWAENLARVVKGQNKLPNDGYLEGMSPEAVMDAKKDSDIREYLREKNMAFSEHNQREIEKRASKLKEAGAFRVQDKISSTTFRKRGFKPNFDAEVHIVKNVDGAYVEDTKGKKFLTKLLLPVPAPAEGAAESRPARIEQGGSAQRDQQRRRVLQDAANSFVEELRKVPGQTVTMQQINAFTKKYSSWDRLAREARLGRNAVREFLQTFPEMFDLSKRGSVKLQEAFRDRTQEPQGLRRFARPQAAT